MVSATHVSATRWGALDSSGCKVFQLHAGQRDVLLSKARFTAAIAGTGGGKTAVGPVWIAAKIQQILGSGRDLDHDPILGMVVAPTYKVMARATAPTLIRAFAGTDLEGEYIESRGIYRLPNNMGLIWLLSADNPGGLEGGQFDFAWLDEGGQLKYDAWIAIQGRLGLKEAPCLITTTPYGRNWLYHKFYKLAKGGDRNYFVRQWSSVANPAYPKAEYERAMNGGMSLQRARMRYDGQFVKMAGLVYPDLDHCIRTPEALFGGPDLPPGRQVGGIDFGWNDPFAALAAVEFRDSKNRRCLYVWYERYKRYCTTADHAKALPPGVRWFADPSRPDSIAELRKADHVVTGAYNNILIGIDAVSNRVYNNTLFISPACRAVLAEADSYTYPQEDDETKGDKPVGGFDHALDALRYLVATADRGRVALSDEERND